MPLHGFEKIIEQALRSRSDGPWTADDLRRVGEIIDDHFCDRHQPDCKSSAVLEWLDSLDEIQQEELLFEVNTEWSASQDRWALG